MENQNRMDSDALYKYLNEQELEIFHGSEIADLLNVSQKDIQLQLESLAKRGFLSRIERNLYCRPNFGDEKVIASYLVNEGTIAYWSSLNVLGLTEQIPNTVFVQTIRQKQSKTVFGVRYKFIRVMPERYFGVVTKGYGSRKYRITSVEKTLIDCFDMVQHSGGFEELVMAFLKADMDKVRLLEYGKRNGNISVLKRIAFLSELFELPGFKIFHQEVKRMLNYRYSVLNPQGEDKGKIITDWMLRLNIPEEKLIQLSNKLY